jgi:hypothetical protein
VRVDTLVGYVEDNRDLFNAETIVGFVEGFEALLSQVLADPDARFSRSSSAKPPTPRDRRARSGPAPRGRAPAAEGVDGAR